MSDQELATQLPPFLEVLRERPILSDGSMATMIYKKGVYINQSFENLNVARPHMVKNIHMEYVRAGAEIMCTNTFSANERKLSKHGLGDKTREINLAGVRLAREAAEGNAWIAGVVGPPGSDVEGHYERFSEEELRHIYEGQISALVEGVVDALFFESFSHLPTLRLALECARKIDPQIPLVAMVRLEEDGQTRFGVGEKELGRAFAEMDAEVVGLSEGPSAALLNEAIAVIHDITDKPLVLMPGAGFPIEHEDRLLNMATPEYFMELLRKGMHKGARLIGGASGCHPEHIKAIKSSIKMLIPGDQQTVTAVASEGDKNEKKVVQMKEFDTPSRLQRRLREGKFVVSIEIDPPIGTDATKSLEAAAVCRDANIDAINIADGPRATARMGPIDMAMLLMQQVPGIEPIVHFCCRDRNILGMQADLIGANALGLHNILMITGDPPKLGDYPFATAVYDVDAIGALGIGARLNEGADLAGNPLRGPETKLFLGAGANPGAIDLDHEIRRLEQKVEAGANYILTQPVYEFALFERFFEKTRHIQVPILLGILPLASYRNAEFLTKEVPGMHVPEPIRERLRVCPDKDSARETGVEIAREALAEALPMIAGTYIMPPFNRVDSALAVLEVAKDKIGV